MTKKKVDYTNCKHCCRKIQSIHIVNHEAKCSKKQKPNIKLEIPTQNKPISKTNIKIPKSKPSTIRSAPIEIKASPNPQSINNRNLKSAFLALYHQQLISWDEVYFVKRALKAGHSFRYEIKMAEPEWTLKIPLIKKLAPQGLDCYFTRVNGEKRIFAVYNLDIILGVCMGILDPERNDYSRVTIDRIDEQDVIKIIHSSPLYKNRIPFLTHIITIQAKGYDIFIVKESIDYYNLVPKTRLSFLFTVLKPNGVTGLFVLESLDENTATHLFKIDSFMGLDYMITKAKLRNYFQSNITNKRQKLYNDQFTQGLTIDKVSTLHHLDYESWRYNLNHKIKNN